MAVFCGSSVRDITIQKREGDLVVSTFGHGFFVLDDLTPLRLATDEMLAQDALLMPTKKAWMFILRTPIGGCDKASQGAAFYTAPIPHGLHRWMRKPIRGTKARAAPQHYRATTPPP